MLGFILGPRVTDALSESVITIRLTVDGELVSQRGGSIKDGMAIFELNLLGLLLLHEPVGGSLRDLRSSEGGGDERMEAYAGVTVLLTVATAGIGVDSPSLIDEIGRLLGRGTGGSQRLAELHPPSWIVGNWTITDAVGRTWRYRFTDTEAVIPILEEQFSLTDDDLVPAADGNDGERHLSDRGACEVSDEPGDGAEADRAAVQVHAG